MTVTLRIARRERPTDAERIETFSLPLVDGMTVAAALRHIALNPLTAGGTATSPVAFDDTCVPGRCGPCVMLINGWPGAAHATRLALLEQPVLLEPLRKLPVVRDLVVDRSVIDEQLRRLHTHVPLDTLDDVDPARPWDGERLRSVHKFETCTGCGACLEACPNVGPQSAFVGAAAMLHVDLLLHRPDGRARATQALRASARPGGIADCGNARNCQAVCPAGIPLTSSLARVGGESTRRAWRDLMGG